MKIKLTELKKMIRECVRSTLKEEFTRSFNPGDKVVLNHFELGPVKGTVRKINHTDINTFDPEWIGASSFDEVDFDNLVCITTDSGDFEDLWGTVDQVSRLNENKMKTKKRSTLKETRAKCPECNIKFNVEDGDLDAYCPECGSDGEIEGQKYTGEPRDEFDFDSPMPADFETCGDCGFDHSYEPEESARWHEENDPDFSSYR